MDSNDDIDYICSSHPNAAQFSRLGSQNSPRINLAFADLHPNYSGDIYVCQSSKSVTISYDEVEMYNQYKASQANVNSLVQLFPDGSINICYGESNYSSPGDVCSGWLAAGIEASSSKYYPLPGEPFNSFGEFETWPEPGCYLFTPGFGFERQL